MKSNLRNSNSVENLQLMRVGENLDRDKVVTVGNQMADGPSTKILAFSLKKYVKCLDV